MEPDKYVDTNVDVPQPPPPPKVDNPLNSMQPGEQVVCMIKRHPIGILGIYLVAAIVIAIALAAAVLLPTLLPDISSQAKLGTILAALLVAVGTLIYVWAASTVYNANRWIVTTDSITQVSQLGLFDTQSSQLSMESIEDVTATQDGVMQDMLGFGTLRVETAGEHSKFVFPYCPNPNEQARKILNAREQYLQGKGERRG